MLELKDKGHWTGTWRSGGLSGLTSTQDSTYILVPWALEARLGGDRGGRDRGRGCCKPAEIILGADLQEQLGGLEGLGQEDGGVLPDQFVDDILDRADDRGRGVGDVVLVVEVGEDVACLGRVLAGRAGM